MSQSGERLIAFVISVVLCCMMSGSLSLLAKRSRGESTVTTRTARLVTSSEALHSSTEGGVISGSDGFLNDSMDTTQAFEDQGGIQHTVRTVGMQPASGSFVTAAILCLCAAMCCAITAVGALMLLRGPRGDGEYLSEDEDSDQVVIQMKGRKQKTIEKTLKGSFEEPRLVRDEVDEITPEEAV